jgi:peptide deformylase
MKEILQTSVDDLDCPQSILRVPSVTTLDIDIDPSEVVTQLVETLAPIPYGTGLSAIQIGIPIRIAIVTLNRTRGNELVIIDPVAKLISGRKVPRSEGCLSLPGFKGLIVRRNKITFSAKDLLGQQYTYFATGYEAAIIQHELDHMDGLFFWDRMDYRDQLNRIDDKKRRKE